MFGNFRFSFDDLFSTRLRNKKPCMCPDDIFSNTFAVEITKAKIVLGSGMSLERGFPIPFYSLCVIFENSLSVVIATSKCVLCFGITTLRRFLEPLHSFGMVLSDTLALLVTNP